MVVYEVPFTRFYGNDIYARDNISFNDSGLDNGQGSIAEYAAMAANTPAIDTAFARGLGAVFSNALKAVNTSYPVSSFDLPKECSSAVNIGAGVDTCSNVGDITIPASNYTKKITINSNGNVYINGNITNATPSYGDPANIGVLLIRANNIYIGKDVKRIDAILVANNTIYTCATNSNSEASKGNWHKDPAYEGCRSTLTINGSLLGPNIRFTRTGGSRLLANGADKNGSDAFNNIPARPDGGYASGQPAEVINYPTYLYYARPNVDDVSNSVYGSIFNAPPRR
ncbi:hypothetical protein KA025_03030, partial [Candidatus Saccharibacteria bacterium]|nr:hypothetical protein [Candidatus Saccharibacteria bacterium]